jgi:hypothetical protein
VSDYRVRFSATSSVPLADDAATRLETALVTMPGIDEVAGVGPASDGPGVRATF